MKNKKDWNIIWNAYSVIHQIHSSFRVVMTVYFTIIFEGYHLKIKLLKKSHNFYFPAKCNNWGRSIKIRDKMLKLVHNAKKNRYIRTHFSFFLATPYLLSYPLQSFGGKFKIVKFFKQLDFLMVPLKLVCKLHRHYYSKWKKFKFHPFHQNFLFYMRENHHFLNYVLTEIFCEWQ